MTRDEYRREMRRLVRDVYEHIASGEIDSEDSFQQWIHETIDGHQYVIYTAKARHVLAHSDNDGATIDNFGSEGIVSDGCLNWSLLAYGAMEADLIEAIHAWDNFPAAWFSGDDIDPKAEARKVLGELDR